MRSFMILLCLAAAEAGGAESTPDRLVFSGRFDRLVSRSSGGSGGMSWIRSTESDLILEAGAFANKLGEASWHYGRFGLVAVKDRTNVRGSVELGGGRDEGDGFVYFIARGGAGYGIVERKLYVSMDAEYLNVNRTKGLLAKGAMTWYLESRLALTGEYRQDIAGTLDAGQFMGRVDWYRRRFHLLGGASTGTFLDHEFLFLGLDTGRQTEWFSGMGFPVGKNQMTVVWSTLRSETSTRHSLGVSVQMALGKPE